MSCRKIDGAQGFNALPKRFVTLYCSEAATRGQIAMLDAAVDVVEAETTAANAGELACKVATATADLALAFGVFEETITAAGYVRVQVSGFCDTLTADASAGINRGDLVGTDDTNAGRVWAFAGTWNATKRPFGVCVNAFTANTADGAILIEDKGWFYPE